jgi:catechol 2,3-dioxygenase-like lactoylglutathione lyase family enzyme
MKMTRLIPMLPVANLARTIAFYEKLGFKVEQRRDDWGWAMLCLDDCRVMVDRSINVDARAPRLGVLYLYFDDLGELHRRVRQSGLSVPEPEVTFYGMTEFRLDDPDGNRLWLGQVRSSAA